MIIVVASISIKPGQRDKFLDIFKPFVPQVLAEEGCIDYLPTIDFDSGMPMQRTDEDRVTVIERWESLAALQTHLAAPHMAQFGKDTESLVTGTDIQMFQPI